MRHLFEYSMLGFIFFMAISLVTAASNDTSNVLSCNLGGTCNVTVTTDGKCATISGYTYVPTEDNSPVTICAGDDDYIISNGDNGCIALLNATYCGEVTFSVKVPVVLCVSATGTKDGQGTADNICSQLLSSKRRRRKRQSANIKPLSPSAENYTVYFNVSAPTCC